MSMLNNSVLNTNKTILKYYKLSIDAGQADTVDLTSSISPNKHEFRSHFSHDSVISSIKEVLDAVHIHYEGGLIADKHQSEGNINDVFDKHPRYYEGVYALRDQPTWNPDNLSQVEIFRSTLERGIFFNSYKKDKILTININVSQFILDIPYSDNEYIQNDMPFTNGNTEGNKLLEKIISQALAGQFYNA